MTIKESEAMRMMDAMACTFTRTYFTLTNEEPTVEQVEMAVRDLFVKFCEAEDITDVETEESHPCEYCEEDTCRHCYINDDVDETNYNPYTGQNEYETNEPDWFDTCFN